MSISQFFKFIGQLNHLDKSDVENIGIPKNLSDKALMHLKNRNE